MATLQNEGEGQSTSFSCAVHSVTLTPAGDGRAVCNGEGEKELSPGAVETLAGDVCGCNTAASAAERMRTRNGNRRRRRRESLLNALPVCDT